MKLEFTFASSVASAVSNFDSIVEFEKQNTVNFGIQFLDDAFGGLSPKDLFLIGGGTGGGKSQLAMSIGAEAARLGRNVMMYALEAERDEIMMRLLYRKFAAWYFNKAQFATAYISFDQFMRGEPDLLVKQFKAETCNLDEYDKMNVQYFDDGFDVDRLEKCLIEAVASGTQLIIIDHLHYFDLASENENQEIKRILKLLRSFVLDKQIPVILVAHIRKQNEMFQKLTPGVDDFHGSSDIAKIATKAVTLSAMGSTPIVVEVEKIKENKVVGIEYEVQPTVLGGGTFIRAVKNRRNGSVSAHTIFSQFDVRGGGYRKNYYLGTPVYVDRKIAFKKITEREHIPEWAKGASI